MALSLCTRATKLSIEYEIVVQGLIQYLNIIYCLDCNRGLSIEYVYCGLRAGPVNIYIIEFYLEGNNYSICQSSMSTVVYGLAQ